MAINADPLPRAQNEVTWLWEGMFGSSELWIWVISIPGEVCDKFDQLLSNWLQVEDLQPVIFYNGALQSTMVVCPNS